MRTSANRPTPPNWSQNGRVSYFKLLTASQGERLKSLQLRPTPGEFSTDLEPGECVNFCQITGPEFSIRGGVIARHCSEADANRKLYLSRGVGSGRSKEISRTLIVGGKVVRTDLLIDQ